MKLLIIHCELRNFKVLNRFATLAKKLRFLKIITFSFNLNYQHFMIQSELRIKVPV